MITKPTNKRGEMYTVYVNFTRNNLIFSVIENKTKKLILIESCGSAGILNRWKTYEFSYLETSQRLSKRLFMAGIKNISLIFKGRYRKKSWGFIVKGLLYNKKQTKIKIYTIKDITNISFNGSKLKIRRVEKRKTPKGLFKHT